MPDETPTPEETAAAITKLLKQQHEEAEKPKPFRADPAVVDRFLAQRDKLAAERPNPLQRNAT